MSFSLNVKEEIISHVFSRKQKLSLLNGFIKYNGELLLTNGDFKLRLSSISSKIIRTIYSFIKEIYKFDVNISVIQSSRLKKNKFYHLFLTNDVKNFLKDNLIYDIDEQFKIIEVSNEVKKNEAELRAYISGIFIACGSVNSPQTSNYHLEVQFKEEKSAVYFKSITKLFDFDFKQIKRKDNYVCYIKKSTVVSDFLKLIDAPNSVMEFENERIERDFSNSINRINNIDIYNQIKVSSTSDRQIEQINNLINKNKLTQMSDKAQQLAKIRLAYPNYSFSELVDEMYNKGIPITKSGISNLFKIIAKHSKE